MWPSTAQGLQALSVVALWVATITGAIAVGAGWLSNVANNRAGDLIQADADKRIAGASARGHEALAEVAKANEGVATAQSETAKANALAAKANERAQVATLALEKERVARLALEKSLAPRSLSPDDARLLLAALKGAPHTMAMSWTTSDFEAEQLKDSLKRVFTQAGWRINEYPTLRFGQSGSGVELLLNKVEFDKQEVPVFSIPIIEALKRIGLMPNQPGASVGIDIPPGEIGLWIGHKP